MKTSRSHVVWIPRSGSGKVRNFLISPSLLRIFSFVLVVCICSIPFLEKGLLSVTAKVAELEKNKLVLEEEIARLSYIRRSLSRIEEKECQLREYYGMEKIDSLNAVMGGWHMEFNGAAEIIPPVETMQNRRDRREALPEKLSRISTNLDAFHHLFKKQMDAWESVPSIVPIEQSDYRITSGFGWRKNPFNKKDQFHAGLDLAGPKGTFIISPASGHVTRTGYDRWLGNYIVIEHTSEIKTIYGHLDRVLVESGDQVERGHRIGEMGNTGLSTSTHLHYAVVVNQRAVDPLQFVLSQKAGEKG